MYAGYFWTFGLIALLGSASYFVFQGIENDGIKGVSSSLTTLIDREVVISKDSKGNDNSKLNLLSNETEDQNDSSTEIKLTESNVVESSSSTNNLNVKSNTLNNVPSSTPLGFDAGSQLKENNSTAVNQLNKSSVNEGKDARSLSVNPKQENLGSNVLGNSMRRENDLSTKKSPEAEISKDSNSSLYNRSSDPKINPESIANNENEAIDSLLSNDSALTASNEQNMDSTEDNKQQELDSAINQANSELTKNKFKGKFSLQVFVGAFVDRKMNNGKGLSVNLPYAGLELGSQLSPNIIISSGVGFIKEKWIL